MKVRVREHFKNFQKMSYMKDDENLRNNKAVLDCSHGINPFKYTEMIHQEKDLIKNAYIHGYPPAPFVELKTAISEYWSDVIKVDIDRVRIGIGAMGILDTINKVFIEKNIKVLGYCPQFSEYISYVRKNGGIYEYVSLKEQNNYKFDYRDIINQMNDEHHIIYIDNPNNPTGQIIPISELIRIIEEAEKKKICVVLDEAYGDFMDKANSAMGLIDKYENLFVVKSFSKGYGIPGLRMGFMVCSSSLLEYFDIVHEPYNNNVVGLRSALLSMKDHTFIPDSIKGIVEIKKKFIDSLSKLSVLETDLEVPIMALQHPNEEIDLYEALIKNNILTIANFVGVGKNTVRLRIPPDVDRLIKLMKNLEETI